MASADATCILNPCSFKRRGGHELKVKANCSIIEQLELSREFKDAKDNGDDIYICLRHLHPVINGSASGNDCLNNWLQNKKLPERFVVGSRRVPKTYKLSTYRKLQKQQKSKVWTLNQLLSSKGVMSWEIKILFGTIKLYYMLLWWPY